MNIERVTSRYFANL